MNEYGKSIDSLFQQLLIPLSLFKNPKYLEKTHFDMVSSIYNCRAQRMGFRYMGCHTSFPLCTARAFQIVTFDKAICFKLIKL